MSLPWPTRDAAGTVIKHPWTGGPHGWDASCAASYCIGTVVPDKPLRSGLDFGTGGGADWDVYAVGPGTLVYKGSFGTNGFGAGAITQHGDLFVLYGHMDEASIAAAPAIGTAVDRGTKLGSTWCTGTDPCSATSGAHHLHLELRTGLTLTGGTVTLGTTVPWNGRTIGGWTITAGTLNYNGTASAPACGKDLTADVAGPAIYDASTCGGTPAPTTTPTPTVGPTPTPAPVLSGNWVAPKEGATVKTSSLKLQARPTASLADVSVTKVRFMVSWGKSAPVKACTAVPPADKGLWSCTADLWRLGAPLGKLTLSFDVFDDASDLAHSPAGTRTVTFAAPPPAPTGVRFKWMELPGGDFKGVQTVRWNRLAIPGVRINIYGVKTCVAHPGPGGRCVVPGLHIPASDLVLLGRVPGATGTFSWDGSTAVGPWIANNNKDWFYGVIVRATNDAGTSSYVVAASSINYF